jgi:ATP-dependent Lon protease
MLSLAMDRPVSQRLAMTGEVSLTGRVLPIGGVKEKTMGAKRSGIDTLIFPEENRRDWVELSDEVRAGITVHFAKSYADVFRVAFPEDEAEVAPVVQAPDVFGRCVSRWQHFWDKD